MILVVFEDTYHNRLLRKFYRLRQLDIKNGTKIFIDSKNDEDCGWWEVQEQRIGIGRGLFNRVAQFFTLSPIYL